MMGAPLEAKVNEVPVYMWVGGPNKMHYVKHLGYYMWYCSQGQGHASNKTTEEDSPRVYLYKHSTQTLTLQYCWKHVTCCNKRYKTQSEPCPQ